MPNIPTEKPYEDNKKEEFRKTPRDLLRSGFEGGGFEQPELKTFSLRRFDKPQDLVDLLNELRDIISKQAFIIDTQNRRIITNSDIDLGNTTQFFLKLKRNFKPSGVIQAESTGTSVAGDDPETSLASYTISANSLSLNDQVNDDVGNILKITANGIFTTDDASAELSLHCKIGSTTYHTIVANTGNVTNAPWRVNWEVMLTDNGSTGTAESYASAQINDIEKDSCLTSANTIDTTVEQELKLTATWSNGDSGDSVTIKQFMVEVLN